MTAIFTFIVAAVFIVGFGLWVSSGKKPAGTNAVVVLPENTTQVVDDQTPVLTDAQALQQMMDILKLKKQGVADDRQAIKDTLAAKAAELAEMQSIAKAETEATP